jgi:hypothetical protein
MWLCLGYASIYLMTTFHISESECVSSKPVTGATCDSKPVGELVGRGGCVVPHVWLKCLNTCPRPLLKSQTLSKYAPRRQIPHCVHRNDPRLWGCRPRAKTRPSKTIRLRPTAPARQTVMQPTSLLQPLLVQILGWHETTLRPVQILQDIDSMYQVQLLSGNEINSLYQRLL